MPSTETVRVRNCIHVTNIFSFRVNVQICWSQNFRTNLGLDLDTIKKARNELDGACGLPLVLVVSFLFNLKILFQNQSARIFPLLIFNNRTTKPLGFYVFLNKTT